MPTYPPSVTRRDFLHHLGVGLAGASLSHTLRAGTRDQSLAGSRPNIVLILADDLGFSDLGCFGSTVIETPHLDRLAAEGTRFTQIYNNAKCAPSRASLLTGLYAQQTGCHGPHARMENGVTVAEVLRPSGYRTWMSGKWHAAETPFRRGFERAFALCDGHSNFWTSGYADPDGRNFTPDWAERRRARWAIDDQEFAEWIPPSPDFYATDAFTDAAVGFLRAGAADPAPFFLHLAYTAPHFPLHAHPEDIDKYRGRFRHGWDQERARRLAHQRKLGLIDPHWPVAPRDERVPAWDSLGEAVANDWDLRMAVYAAMIDRMDRGIGRLVYALEETGRLNDTLIVFLSDNGGCAEEYNLTPDLPPGPRDGFRTLDIGWASATNTPFRKFKNWDHEGGICTPCIAHWPERIPAGRIAHDVGHFIDFMPTFLALSGAAYPETHDNQPVLPCEGRSLAPLLAGGTRPGLDLLCWQFGAAAAARRGPWKIVRRGRQNPWELYHIERDRTETRDLATVHTDIVAALAHEWHAWAGRVGARI